MTAEGWIYSHVGQQAYAILFSNISDCGDASWYGAMRDEGQYDQPSTHQFGLEGRLSYALETPSREQVDPHLPVGRTTLPTVCQSLDFEAGG